MKFKNIPIYIPYIFISDSIYLFSTRSNAPEEAEDSSDGMDIFSESSLSASTPKRRKDSVEVSEVRDEFKKAIRDYREKLSNREHQDSDTLFMKSIISMMKDLPETDKNDLKKSFLDQVIEKRNKHFSRNTEM